MTENNIQCVFKLNKGTLTLNDTWTVKINDAVVMPVAVCSDFVEVIRENFNFSSTVKTIATMINILIRKTIRSNHSPELKFLTISDLIIQEFTDLPVLTCLKNSCIETLVSISILYIGDLYTASWCATDPAYLWEIYQRRSKIGKLYRN